jgi:catechol 2,3-dioxygenase-like lactoylglutathione lyase family enzyme
MVRIGAIVLNVADAGRAGDFWSKALGYQRGGNPDFLLPVHGDGPRLHLDETDRTHLDLWAVDEAEQRAEVERLEALGATRVEWDYPEDADFVVLADPDGNLFCVIDTSA